MTITRTAVEAAAKWLHDHDCRSALHSGFPPDFECYDWLDEARELLEVATPHMLSGVSTLDELVMLEPGTVIQGPRFHEETYKCTAPGTFHAIASPTEYRPSELVARGPFAVIYRPTP